MYRQENKIKIPRNFDYNLIKGLSNETKDIRTQFENLAKVSFFTRISQILSPTYLKHSFKYSLRQFLIRKFLKFLSNIFLISENFDLSAFLIKDLSRSFGIPIGYLEYLLKLSILG